MGERPWSPCKWMDRRSSCENSRGPPRRLPHSSSNSNSSSSSDGDSNLCRGASPAAKTLCAAATRAVAGRLLPAELALPMPVLLLQATVASITIWKRQGAFPAPSRLCG